MQQTYKADDISRTKLLAEEGLVENSTNTEMGHITMAKAAALA